MQLPKPFVEFSHLLRMRRGIICFLAINRFYRNQSAHIHLCFKWRRLFGGKDKPCKNLSLITRPTFGVKYNKFTNPATETLPNGNRTANRFSGAITP